MSASSDYVELHAHTAFSFQDGASQPDELALAAAEHGYTHLAATDHDNLCGALEFAHAAKAAGLQPITGVELTVEDELGRLCHATLLARTADGYANICRLVTLAYAPRGTPALLAASAGDATALSRAWLREADGSAERARGMGHRRGVRAGRGQRAASERAASERSASERAASGRVPGRKPSEAALVRGSALRPDPLVTIEQLCAHAQGITLLTGCASRGLLAGDIAAGRPGRAAQLVERLRDAFGVRDVYVELQLPQQRGDSERCRSLKHVAQAAGVGVVATGNVHAHTVARGRLHDALVAIRLNTTLEACEGERDGNLARVLRSPEEMARRFADHPEAVRATREIADRIEFDLTAGVGYQYPDMTQAGGPPADEQLAGITVAELERRYAGRPTLEQARARLERELMLIRKHGLSGFFLLHRDVLELARDVASEVRGMSAVRHLNPPGRGRGSSVESIVCYLTGLSHVDPIESKLRGGRFLNEDLPTMPDIDLDFPRDIRHGLLARVVGRYGADKCAMVAAHATYRSRGAIRDLGKALGLPQAELARVGARTDTRDAMELGDALGARHTGPRWDAFRMLANEIKGLPRVMGQHSGGLIISTEPLRDVVPIQPAATPGRQLVQWDKDSCSDAGFLKIDILGLGMLSAVEECVETIAATGHGEIDLSRIALDDPAVFSEIRAGDTVGTFQIESRAQIQSLKRVRPENIEDLVVQVALIRPGPIIGQSVNPYVAIREARRAARAAGLPMPEPDYDHPLLEPVLRDTYGAIVFQDQVLEVSMALAGFTAGEADGLRRAMTRKRAEGSVEAWRPRFVERAGERGVDAATANRVFDRVIGFCHYGFPRAHSVAFALLAYQSSWLRHHFPAHFHAAVINAEPMGFYPPDSLLRDAGRNGVNALPVDVNVSNALCIVEEVGPRAAAAAGFGRRRAHERAHPAIRVGLGCVRGVGYADAIGVQREREQRGAFADLGDFMRRAALRTDQIEQLVMSGACDSLGEAEGLGRRELLWQVGLVARPKRVRGTVSADHAGGVDHAGGAGSDGGQLQAVEVEFRQDALELAAPAAPSFAQLSMWDEVLLDYATQGMSVREHPVELLRPLLGERVVTIAHAHDQTPHRQTVDVVGAVTARQKPGTAKGVVFLLLEDGTGAINVIVGPELYKAERTVIRGESIVRVRGRIERHERVVNLIAREVHRLPKELQGRSPQKMRGKAWG